MQPVPPEVWANFERRLDAMRVPPPQRPDYRKWVRFYFDFSAWLIDSSNRHRV